MFIWELRNPGMDFQFSQWFTASHKWIKLRFLCAKNAKQTIEVSSEMAKEKWFEKNLFTIVCVFLIETFCCFNLIYNEFKINFREMIILMNFWSFSDYSIKDFICRIQVAVENMDKFTCKLQAVMQNQLKMTMRASNTK